jgi:hypothetical protein
MVYQAPVFTTSTHPKYCSRINKLEKKLYHVTPLLHSLYWLPVQERIEYNPVAYIHDQMIELPHTHIHILVHLQASTALPAISVLPFLRQTHPKSRL